MSEHEILNGLVDLITARVEARLKQTPKRLLTVREAAAYIGRTPGATSQLAARNEIPHIRAGRRVHFEVPDLDKWIERNRVE